MPGGNFDYELQVQPNGTVRARGPLEAGVTSVTELDIWVFQKIDEVDAIANNMGSPQPQGQPGLHVFDLGTDHAHWEFRLPRRYSSASFAEGSATAMGIGAFVDDEETPDRLLVVRGGNARAAGRETTRTTRTTDREGRRGSGRRGVAVVQHRDRFRRGR